MTFNHSTEGTGKKDLTSYSLLAIERTNDPHYPNVIQADQHSWPCPLLVLPLALSWSSQAFVKVQSVREPACIIHIDLFITSLVSDPAPSSPPALTLLSYLYPSLIFDPTPSKQIASPTTRP